MNSLQKEFICHIFLVNSILCIQNIEFLVIFSNEFILWIHNNEVKFMNSDWIQWILISEFIFLWIHTRIQNLYICIHMHEFIYSWIHIFISYMNSYVHEFIYHFIYEFIWLWIHMTMNSYDFFIYQFMFHEFMFHEFMCEICCTKVPYDARFSPFWMS